MQPHEPAGDEEVTAIEVHGGSFAWGVKPALRLGDDSDDDGSSSTYSSQRILPLSVSVFNYAWHSLSLSVSPCVSLCLCVSRCVVLVGAGNDEEKPEADAREDPRSKSTCDLAATSDSSAVPDRVAFRLDAVELSVPSGSLVAVVGPVGSGKTSLLHALLGEMDCEGEPVTIRGSVAYAPQTPFILNATLKDNVGFGRDVEASRAHYDACLQACALSQDIKNMKKGDKTAIGESGETISGGQKQRLSLARAAFADADIVLLDDCLSAVDAMVGAHIWEHCISNNGLMKGKTRVFVTHALQYLQFCDTIFVMDKGVVVERGTLASLLSTNAPVMCSLMATYDKNQDVVQALANPKLDGDERRTDAKSGVNESSRDSEKDDSVQEKMQDLDHADDSESSSDDELTGEEERSTGDVKIGPIWKYVQAAGVPHSFGTHTVQCIWHRRICAIRTHGIHLAIQCLNIYVARSSNARFLHY